MLRISLTLAAIAALCASGLAGTPDSVPGLNTNVVKGADGKLYLKIIGTTPGKGAKLGVSFYEPDYTDPVWGGEHSVYAVTGSFEFGVPVPAGYEQGSYEVGLWKEKLGENTFYRAERLRAYGSGSLASGAVAAALADTVAALATGVADKDGKRVLKVTGKAPDANDWLGVSFYKANYADAVLDGSYTMMQVPSGEFSQAITVPAGYEGGTYEVALWGRLGAKKKVFRLDGALGYGAGKVGR